MELFRLLGTIIINNADAVKALNDTSKAGKDTAKIIQDANEKVGKKFTDTGKKLTKYVTKPAIAAGTALAGMTIAKGWSRMVQIDSAKAKLMGLGHSAESVSKIMDNALESVKGTSYGMDEAATAAASAVAAGIPVGNELTRYLTLIGDAAAIAGTSMSDMGSIFNKVASNGKISAEEMNQLADRGIPIFQLLAETTGLSMEEVRKAVSSGKIGIEELQDAIEKGMGGAAKTMGSTTITGAIANIGASISRIGANFLGSSDDAKSFAGQLLPLLNDVQEWLGKVEEKAKVMGEKFGESFRKAVAIIRSIPAPIMAIGTATAVLTGPLLQVTGKFIKASTAINKARVAYKNYQLAANGASLATGIMKGELSAEQAVLGKVSELTGKAINGMKSLPSLMVRAAGSIKSFTTSTAISAATTARDTAAKVVNAVATSKVATAAKGAAVKVLAFANAHKVAMLSSLGLIAPLVLLGVYMSKTGKTGEEIAADITAFSNKLAAMITSFAENLPVMIDAVLPALTSTIEGVAEILPALVPVMLKAGIDLFMTLVDSIQQIATPLITALVDVVNALVAALPTMIPQLIQAGITLLMALVDAVPQIIPSLVSAIPQIVTAVIQAIPVLIPALLQASITLWMTFVKAIPQVVKALVAAIPQIINALKTGLATGCSKVWDIIKKTASKKWKQITKSITTPIKSLISSVKSGFEKIKNNMIKPIETARNKIKGVLNKIKGFFPLSVGKIFSNLKLPKISVTTTKGKLGIPVPHFDVKWNAKGAIFDQPTIFATSQGFQGVGEAGAEAVAPIDTLKQYVSESVASQNGQLVGVLNEILEAIKTMDAGVYGKIENALDNRKIEWNNRELGRFVKTYA